MSKRSRRHGALASSNTRQHRHTKQFVPSTRQITTAIELITDALKRTVLKAHDHANAAAKLLKELGHKAFKLGNTDGQRCTTIRLVLTKLVGDRMIRLLENKEYVLAA